MPTTSPSPPATATPTPTAAPTPAATATPAPSPTPKPTAAATPTTSIPPSGSPSGALIATFQVGAQTYRVEIVDPEQIEIAHQLLAGEEAPSIPNGRIVRGDAGVNTGWSWHIDPQDFAFADVTIELCDGLPSYVEDGSLTGDRFCPWSAQLVELTPAP